MLHLCRTCHGETAAHNCVATNDDTVTSVRIKSQLLSCVPELQQDLVKDPVLCSPCVDALHLSYAFKVQCLQTEGRIQNYFQNTTLIAQTVTLLELYKDFSETHNFIKVEDLTVKLSNSVACDDADEVADTKNFVIVHQVPIPKEEVYDINKEGINDLKNNSASEVNQVSIVKEQCEIIQFKVDEDSFKQDASVNEFEKNMLGLPVVTLSSISRYNISQDLDDTEEDAIVKEECEILIVKSEKDEVLSIKNENINDEEKASESCITVTLSEDSNLVGADITEESPNVTHDTDVKDLFDGDYESPLSTTEDDIFEENYSSYSNDSYVDAASLADAPANTNINAHKAASVKNWSVNHEVERTNNWSTSSSHKLTNPYTVSMHEFPQEINDTGGAIIVKQEHELATFKTEDCTVNVDLPIKECFVNIERFPVHLRVLMNKSSFNINELLNSRPRRSLEDITKKPENVRETNKTVRRNFIKNKRACTNEELFHCKICDFISRTKLSLLKHNRTHKGKKGYCCNVCEYSAACKRYLVEHMLKHTSNKPFRCTTCDYKTARKRYLVKHVLKHTGNKPFRCIICYYRTARKEDLVRHLRIHSSEKPFRCSTCDYTTATKTNLVEHLKNHTGEKPFCCDICGHRTRTKQCWVAHMRIHTGERPYACDLCEFTAIRKQYLTVHMRTHTKEKKFHCSTCEYSAATKARLVAHLRTHTGEKQFCCDVCGQRMRTEGNLISHMVIHTGEKPFSCKICEFRTAHKRCLVAHMRTHMGEKPFHCDICEFSAIRKSTLTAHMCTHTSEKPYRCNACEFSTARKYSLVLHQRTHTGEKPFHCNVCEYTATAKGNLVVHMRKHAVKNLL